tara:strand:- start:3256 stop:3924 length:669 start_codon:yes stop_codon:yes gene_type:complete
MVSIELVKKSVYISLVIQVITGVIQLYPLFMDIPEEYNILKQTLALETVVQFIEAAFYSWLAYGLYKMKDVTATRYFDWAITTPIMLLSTSIYLEYLKNKDLKLMDFLDENKNLIMKIVIANWLMLFTGFLGETKRISHMVSIPIGFLFFGYSFYKIYENFAVGTVEGMNLFMILTVIWSLYGIVSPLSTNIKNLLYNILDMFSKNFYGLFLFYKIMKVVNI